MPTSVAGFDVESVLGRGTLGVVYKARDHRTARTLALKVIGLNGATKEDTAECINELRILRSLEHPHLLRYEEAVAQDDSLVVCSEFAALGDLQRLIERHRRLEEPLEEDLVWKLLVQMLCGLDYLHSRRVLHRNIKPSNVFLDTSLNAKLGDVALLRVLSRLVPQAVTSPAGTLPFMAPELLRGEPYSDKTDVWALGVTLCAAATRRLPFDGPNPAAMLMAVMRGAYEPPRGASEALAGVISACLTQGITDRPTSRELLALPAVRERARQLGIALPAASSSAASSPTAAAPKAFRVSSSATGMGSGPARPLASPRSSAPGLQRSASASAPGPGPGPGPGGVTQSSSGGQQAAARSRVPGLTVAVPQFRDSASASPASGPPAHAQAHSQPLPLARMGGGPGPGLRRSSAGASPAAQVLSPGSLLAGFEAAPAHRHQQQQLHRRMARPSAPVPPSSTSASPSPPSSSASPSPSRSAAASHATPPQRGPVPQLRLAATMPRYRVSSPAGLPGGGSHAGGGGGGGGPVGRHLSPPPQAGGRASSASRSAMSSPRTAMSSASSVQPPIKRQDVSHRQPRSRKELALLAAARSGAVDDVERLLRDGGVNPNVEDQLDGLTPLYMATRDLDTELVAVLLAAGADPGARVKDGRSPLHLAARRGYLDLVRAFLAVAGGTGAPPSGLNARDADGCTPLHLAAWANYTEIRTARTKPFTLTTSATAADYTEVVRLLLRAGADVGARNSMGLTALHNAAQAGMYAITDALLRAGADPNLCTDNRWTPLLLAVSCFPISTGFVPITSEAMNGYLQVVAALLTAGADPNVKDTDGSAPLHHAIAKGWARGVEALARGGANLGLKNARGRTPLELAQERGPHSLAALLERLVGRGGR